MTRQTVRRLVWVGVALCVVALALGVTERLLTREGTVTEANVGRLREGMSLREVEAILGEGHQRGRSGEGFRERVWVQRGSCAWVAFDYPGGGLIQAQFCDANDPSRQIFVDLFGCPPEPGFLERLRALLGW